MNSRYLLDTQVLIWAYYLPERLSKRATTIIESGDAAVSAVSLWEMMIKKDKPGAAIEDPVAWWQRYVTQRGVEMLPIHAYHVAHLGLLPALHRDPFDRVLICQSIHEKCGLVTIDEEIHRYTDLIVPVW